MREKLLIGVLLAIVASLMTACGISQEDYDAVVAERDAAWAEVASVQKELTDTQKKLENTKTELAAAQNERAKVQSDLTTAQTELSALESDLNATEDELTAKQNQILSLQGDLVEIEARVIELREKIAKGEGSQIGYLPPRFELQDINGNTVSLYDFWGKPIIINFWATWCGPCRSEMPFLQQIYEEWQGKGLVILTINLRESALKVRQFMQEYNLSFPVLLDISGDVSNKYNITGIPTTFFINEFGVIQEKRVGSFVSKQQIEDYLNEIIP